MKIKVNLDYAQPSINEMIEAKLQSAKLPTCLGSMTPPIIKGIVEIDDAKILQPIDSIPLSNLVTKDLIPKILIGGPRNSYTIDVNGKAFVDKLKEEQVIAYANHVIKCAACTVHDLCSKLTTFYLKTIEIMEKPNA